MATDAQKRANKLNAQKSTGPKTLEGKEKSKHNSTKHGLTARHIVLPWEDPESYHELHGALLRQYQPQVPAEMYLVDQIAQGWWRMNRSRRLETQMFEDMNPDTPGPAPDADTIDLHRRYESSISRDFYRAYDRMEKVMRRRERAERNSGPCRPRRLPQPTPDDDFFLSPPFDKGQFDKVAPEAAPPAESTVEATPQLQQIRAQTPIGFVSQRSTPVTLNLPVPAPPPARPIPTMRESLLK